MIMIPRTTRGIRNGSQAAAAHLRLARSSASTTASVAADSEVISEAPKADFPAAKAGIICFHAFALDARWASGKTTEMMIKAVEIMQITVRDEVPSASANRTLSS